MTSDQLIFGDPARFAIQVDDVCAAPPGVLASLCFRCGQTRIGETAPLGLVGTLVRTLKSIATQLPPCPDHLVDLPADALLNTVFALLDDPQPERADYP